MGKVKFDPSEIPPWRKTPRRIEYPITGFRAWRLELLRRSGQKIITSRDMVADAMLVSAAYEVRWEGPKMEADLRPMETDQGELNKRLGIRDKGLYIPTNPVGATMSSGIYALVCPLYTRRVVVNNYNTAVYGAVHLWGRVAIHELGYRAEHCMIQKLVLLANRIHPLKPDSATIAEIVEALEKRYQCEVKVSRREGIL